MSKKIWVEAGELKFSMNMLYYFKLKTTYSELEFFEIRLRVLLKNYKFFLKKCKKKLSPFGLKLESCKFA
jgi:hypothetical protein